MRSQGAYIEGDRDVIVLCQCFLYLVSSPVNVSSFHSMWLDPFWTALVCLSVLSHIRVWGLGDFSQCFVSKTMVIQ